MKNFRHVVKAATVLAVMAQAAVASPAMAADEKARRDVNQVPSTLAITSATPTELRNLRATNEGYLLTVSTGSGAPVSGTVTANQGSAAAASGAWPTKLTDGTDTADVTAASALKVDGSAVTQPVSDAGGTLTVDAVNLDIRDLSSGQDSVASVQSGAWSVTILNGAGASAVNIQDGGNTITVDGTIVANAGTGIFNTSGSSVSVSNVAGTSRAGNDNGGSLTVDSAQLPAALSGGGNLKVSLEETTTSWSTPAVSTGACAAAATAALVANSSAKTSVFCNEGTDAVRGGPAGVTATVGLKVLGSSCVTMDGPLAPFRGALYCIRTTGSDQAFSTMQGQ